jgi:hypothetical protein
MIDNLTAYLRFDPLLAAAIILAVTLVLGRLVDVVRAGLERARADAGKAQTEVAEGLKPVDVADAREA